MPYPPSWLPLTVALTLFVVLFAVIGRFARRVGGTPMTLSFGEDPSGLSGHMLRVLIGAVCAIVAIHAATPQILARLAGTIPLLDRPAIAWAGNGVALAGGALMTRAQLAMGASWRIGIPREQSAPLISNGIYRISRNPIYLGVVIVAAGLVMAIPNAATLAAATAVAVAIAYQVRLEEAHLLAAFGEAYASYMQRTRRWL